MTTVGHDIAGVVVAEVLDIEELTGFNKPIRYCQVSTGDGQERHVICGAANFVVGDRVALGDARSGSARRLRDRRPQDVRPRLGGHDLLRI